MTCNHLNKLEQELINNQIKITYHGQAWSKNCREWVYFDCLFTDLEKTIQRLNIDRNFVKIHSHFGTHDGQEYGLICTSCNDDILGCHPDSLKAKSTEVVKYE
jgi:hypothetical protein